MSKLLTKSQTKKLNSKLSSQVNPNKELIFLLQDVEDGINVGAFFRIADGLGAKLILGGRTPTPPAGGISLTARGLDRSVEWEKEKDMEKKISELKSEGFQIVAVEVEENSVLYQDYKFGDRICLVMGNEAKGVYKKILKLCDASVFLPMLGKGPSLNVHVAGAVVGYEVLAN